MLYLGMRAAQLDTLEGAEGVVRASGEGGRVRRAAESVGVVERLALPPLREPRPRDEADLLSRSPRARGIKAVDTHVCPLAGQVRGRLVGEGGGEGSRVRVSELGLGLGQGWG